MRKRAVWSRHFDDLGCQCHDAQGLIKYPSIQVAMNAIPCHKTLEDVDSLIEKTHSQGRICKMGAWEETSQKPRLSGYLRIRWEW